MTSSFCEPGVPRNRSCVLPPLTVQRSGSAPLHPPERPLILPFLLGCIALDQDQPCTSCVLRDPNQYRYEASLSTAVVHLAAGRDAWLSWSDLSQDIHGHPRNPVADIDEAWLVGFQGLTADAVLEHLSNDTLPQSAIALFQSAEPEGPGVALSDFGLSGSRFAPETYFTNAESLWLLVLRSPEEAGAAAFALLQPDKAVSQTEFVLGDEQSELDVQFDLASVERVQVASDTPELSFDWSMISRDGLGNPFYPPALDTLFLGRFDAPVEELEHRVFDLESLAVERWSAPLTGGLGAELDALQGATPFRGVSPGSTWILALGCGTCTHPAPALLSVLEPA